MKGIFAVLCKPYEIKKENGETVKIENDRLVGSFTETDGFKGISYLWDKELDDYSISEIELTKEEFDQIQYECVQVFTEKN